jgi:hypothetical protein
MTGLVVGTLLAVPFSILANLLTPWASTHLAGLSSSRARRRVAKLRASLARAEASRRDITLLYIRALRRAIVLAGGAFAMAMIGTVLTLVGGVPNLHTRTDGRLERWLDPKQPVMGLIFLALVYLGAWFVVRRVGEFAGELHAVEHIDEHRDATVAAIADLETRFPEVAGDTLLSAGDGAQA